MYTFRAHQGPVLCVAMSATGEECFSGGVDATVRCWNLPSSNIDPYDSYGESRLSQTIPLALSVTSSQLTRCSPYLDSSILQDTLVAHTDAVWGLAIHTTKFQLLSCSADGTVRLWSPGHKMHLSSTYHPPTEGQYRSDSMYKWM